MMLKPELIFDLEGLDAAPLFENVENVWEVLPQIKRFIQSTIKPNVAGIRASGDFLSKTHVVHDGKILTEGLTLQVGNARKGAFKVFHQNQELVGATVVYAGSALLDDQIELGPGVVVEPGAVIKGPVIIGANSEVRQAAYMRGSCLVGRKCVVGHATEAKNTVMLDGAQAGHFAYLGDSILGQKVNLGAGTKLANLKIVPLPISIKVEGENVKVDLRKFGAILGDGTETGCNSVTSPGTIMGKRSLVSPNVTVPSGFHPARSIIRPPK